jgi:hypothetical protein
MSDLHQKAKRVADRESFVRFVELMSADLKTNAQAWENRDLGSFLEAYAGWIEDMDGYYENQKLEKPKNVNWQFMTDALMAARIYE